MTEPFVKVNCAAMPTELVESELFGYKKGAFTGAHADRPGKFEFANSGTIFLDEIGEFTPSIQAKLLQVLQEGRFTRLGSNRETHVDVRIIAATNRKLEEAIEKGAFREDLYYRLNVVNLEVPPLRERRMEIPILCQHFFKKFCVEYNSTVTGCVATFKKQQVSDWSGRSGSVSCNHLEQLVDELNLSPNIRTARPPRLPLPDHVHCLVSLDRSPRRLKLTKPLLGFHSSFDCSMVLLQDVVQVLDRPVAATASQDSFLFHS